MRYPYKIFIKLLARIIVARYGSRADCSRLELMFTVTDHWVKTAAETACEIQDIPC